MVKNADVGFPDLPDNQAAIDAIVGSMEKEMAKIKEESGIVPYKTNKKELEAQEDVQENINVDEDDAESTEKEIEEGVDKKETEEVEDEEKSTESVKQRKYTDVEKEAMKRGWRPREEFDGKDGKKFVSAQTFLDRGDLFERNSAQERQIKKLEDSIRLLTELNVKNQEMVLKEREEYFLAQKNAAIDLGQRAEAEKYEKAHNETREALDNLKPIRESTVQYQSKANPNDPAYGEFVKKNSHWFVDKSRVEYAQDEDIEMTQFAATREVALQRKYPDWNVSKVLEEVENSVKKTYPHRFENKERSRAATVSVPQRDNAPFKNKPTKGKYTFSQLPHEMKSEVRMWAEQSNLSLDDYAQQLFDAGVIK